MGNSMIEKKLRIFVSSVGAMMDEERNTLRDRIWKSGHIPIAMEGFSGNHAQTSIDIVKENLDHADVVIFVLGFTYGSIIGEGLSCSECPVKGCCGAKRKKTGKCVISYTDFEYLYAKQNDILSYCIVQKDIDKEDCFKIRLSTFLSPISDDNKREDKKIKFITQYHENMTKYKKLIKMAQKTWCAFYDANSGSGISTEIINIFSGIQSQLVKDGENIPGLIEGNKVKIELIDKDNQIESLKKELEKARRNSNQFTSEMTTASTGTCIPFKLNKQKNVIITYLVCNTAYSRGGRFMFPGGHAFHDEESPEAVAIIKARIEAGLIVRPIDLYPNCNSRSSAFSEQFTICHPPHFSYLFVEDGSAKCYVEKNHLRHYDATYICEIDEIRPDTECSHKRIEIEVPCNSIDLDKMKEIIKNSYEQYNKEIKSGATMEFCEDYIAQMLIDAHTVYIDYLKREGELQ